MPGGAGRVKRLSHDEGARGLSVTRWTGGAAAGANPSLAPAFTVPFVPMRCLRFSTAATIACLAVFAPAVTAADALGTLRAGFETPPPDSRPMVRWWWFGPAVVPQELEHEMALMREGGFGGFEVQPTYPLALDDQYPGLKNLKFLSPEFKAALGFAARKAPELGLRMDLTLGSGWPYGGPMFSRAEAPQSIAEGGIVTLTPGQTVVTAPPPTRRGESADAPVVAALLGPLPHPAADGSPFVSLPVKGRSAQLPADLQGATQVRFFVSTPARLMQVKRAAYGDEGFIVDHYNPEAVRKFITEVAEPEIAACGPTPPYSVFCDSLEIEGEGWTPDFPAYFRRRNGYDLIPLLPALFDASFPRAADIRGDYGASIAALFDEAFVAPFAQLARRMGTRFRLQAYGTPPTTLSTYAHVDVDEGENYNWRLFSGTRWAASASHALGREVTSSEAFTWLHSPVFMAAPIDLKAESNLQFLNGVNELLYHGWPYTAPGVEYPSWRFYAAAVFNEKNPWWIVMPDINRYLARTSWMLRQGTPMNDVALYLPEEDAFAAMTPSHLQMVQAGGRGLLNQLVNPLVPAILDAGFNFDGIDAGILASHGRVDGNALAFGEVRHRVVILPRMTRITPDALRTLERFAEQGGILLAVDAAPNTAPGYRAAEAEVRAVREISARLFSGPAAKGIVVPADQLAPTLRRKLTPDVSLATPLPALGFVHRRVGGTDLYFVANTGSEPVRTSATFRVAARTAVWWDATTGRSAPAVVATKAETTGVEIALAPYEARFLVFTSPDSAVSDEAVPTAAAATSLDLSRDWQVSFRNAAPEADPAPARLPTLISWTELPETRHFAGVARYTKEFDLPARTLPAKAQAQLSLGDGQAGPVAGGSMGMRANFQPPVADAAVVFVNGQRAGALWCPPYRMDVTGLLHPGRNELRIEVANRASNYMADTKAHPLPDYRALNASRELGGNRFGPQDMSALTATPSGLLGPVTLVIHGNASPATK